MRQSRPIGTPIDDARLQRWIEDFGGYRRNVTRARIAAWLGQFSEKDRDLAARLLDSVEFLSHAAVEEGLYGALNSLPGWNNNREARTGKWRFVAFSRSAGESGDKMLHSLRSAAQLGSAANDDLFVGKRDLLMEELTADDTVVFVDDFAGTGRQVATGWREVMEELLPGRPHIYLVLVAAYIDATNRIAAETPIELYTMTTLPEGDNVFSDACESFSADDKKRLLTYCRRASTSNPRGFGKCGLLLVLAHKTPNNSIPVLHATRNERWSGLFPR